MQSAAAWALQAELQRSSGAKKRHHQDDKAEGIQQFPNPSSSEFRAIGFMASFGVPLVFGREKPLTTGGTEGHRGIHFESGCFGAGCVACLRSGFHGFGLAAAFGLTPKSQM